MFIVRCIEDVGRAVWTRRWNPYLIFGECCAIRASGENVFAGCRIDKGQLVGSQADCWTILLMESAYLVCELASPHIVDIRDTTGSP